jgi:predicted AAA+ superfamily ATPase
LTFYLNAPMYRDDFSKYKTRISISALDETLLSVPQQLTKKYSYSKVSSEINSSTVKQALYLLNKARICTPVVYSAGNGVPLGAEINKKYFKEIFVDVGLCSACLGLELTQLNKVDELIMINRGGIAEQVAGQLLRTLSPAYIEPKLYYWQRTEKDAEAEVDYLIQHKNIIIPVEVKAGSTGTLKSLHLYMAIKKYKTAVRINSDLPSRTEVNVRISADQAVNYTLTSIPFYLMSELHRLIDE